MASTVDREAFPKRLFGSIQSKLILLLCILLIPTLLVQVYVYHKRFESRRTEELQANLEVARAVSKSFETYVMDILHSELVVGLAITSQSIPDQERDRILDEFEADNPAVLVALWLNPNGTVVGSSSKDYVGRDFSDLSFCKEVVRGKKWAVSELMLGGVTAKPGFTIGRGIRNARGELLGILGALIEPDLLDGVLGIERAKGAAIYLMDTKGMLVFRYPRIYPSWEERNRLKGQPQLKTTLNGIEYAWKALYENRTRIMATVPIRSISWVAGAGRSEEVALSTIRAALLPQTITSLLITLAAFGTAFFFSRKISNAIRKLRNHVLALGRGETQDPVDVSGTIELEALAKAFNQMTEDMQVRSEERELAENALRLSENKYRQIVQTAQEGIWVIDGEDRTVLVNQKMADMLGCCVDEMMGKSPKEFMAPEFLENADDRLRDRMNGKNHTLDCRFIRKDGSDFWCILSSCAMFDDSGRFSGSLAMISDITERKQIEEELRRSWAELELRVQERTAELQNANEQLRRIPSRLMAAQEEERRRLAAELHDSIGQTLAAFKFRMEHILLTLRKGLNQEALQIVEEFIPILQRSIDETRAIYMGLRPRILEDFGAVAALRWYRDELIKLYLERHIEMDIRLEEPDIPKYLVIPIFRIAQEALNNVCKHSKAEWVDVSLFRDGNGIELIVSDDGQGMDLNYILQSTTSRTLGLISMRERAELHGGKFSIESAPGEGTTVRVQWPVVTDGYHNE